ncbi:MAG: L-serine ammonia-lyase [bacterium]|nr:L-serine ammonia-lyase [bacterium]
MQSIKEVFRIGAGPSSSHTMGPKRAAYDFKKRTPAAACYRVSLYGSLAATGKGHLTDQTIQSVFAPVPTEFIWKPEEVLPQHPNAMKFEAFDRSGNTVSEWTAFSTGGGTITNEKGIIIPIGDESGDAVVYPLGTMTEILAHLDETGKTFWEYVFDTEGAPLENTLKEVWKVMRASIKRGLDNEGVLPGELGLPRKASSFYAKSKNRAGFIKYTNLVFSYALAVAEENASGGTVAAAPTCGAAGVIPSVVYHLKKTNTISGKKIIRALATAGLIGNLVKTNGSVSGADVGCQGEIGTACAMAAGAAAQLLGGTPRQVEYAAEMGMEHHLGLTCDPVAGLVQIPCIERNAMAAVRALNCAAYALLSDGHHRITFDEVIKTMLETGHDLKSSYRETSTGGLARVHEG